MFQKLSLPVLVTLMCLMIMGVMGLIFLNQNQGFFKAVNGGLDLPYKNITENALIVELIRN